MSSLAAELSGQDSGQEQTVTQKGLRLVSIQFSRIRQFRGHSFRLYTGEQLTDMVEGIWQNGILMPLIVRRVFDDTGHDYPGIRRSSAGNMAYIYVVAECNHQLPPYAIIQYAIDEKLLEEYRNLLKVILPIYMDVLQKHD